MAARRALVLSALGVVAVGGMVLLGWAHTQAPAAAFQAYLPVITLPTVIGAAAIGGINPCTFTVLPVAGILLVASRRAGLFRLARWNLHHGERVRLALGSGVAVMGLVVLATM